MPGDGFARGLLAEKTAVVTPVTDQVRRAGIDKFHGGYNAAKVAQEQTLLEGPLPVRIVRAAQFHEFVDQLVGWTIQDGFAPTPTQAPARDSADASIPGATHEHHHEHRHHGG